MSNSITPDDESSFKVPRGYPASLIYLDESGSKASASKFFVVAAVKVRESGKLARALKDVRERNGFQRGEFKFSEATKGTLCAYYDAIDALEASDAHIAACVVNRTVQDPFRGKSPWEVHAEVTSQLLVGCINRRELVSVLLDGISTPRHVALDDVVRNAVNRRLDSTSVVTAACLDSRCNDGLQLADLVAGAIAFDRKRRPGVRENEVKAKVAARLMAALGLTTFDDVRNDRVNVATFRARSARGSGLRVVPEIA